MRLFEHPDFEQALLRAAAHHEISEQFIEKDYYVTEILRIVADNLGDKVLFKGGTSLSKGWDLITRFSEDIDLFVNPDRFEPPPGKNKLDKILKGLAEAVADHPALTWLREEGSTIGGLGRNDVFAYETYFGDLPGLRAAVRLEPGIQSGDFPTEVVPITSLVAQYLAEHAPSDFAGLDDLPGFDMCLLHYRRTFVEKMFALHGKVVRLAEEGHPLGRDARHYPDLYTLAGEYEVRPPSDLSFANSPALFPDADLRDQLATEFEEQCRLLFAGDDYPTFDEVLARFGEIRKLL